MKLIIATKKGKVRCLDIKPTLRGGTGMDVNLPKGDEAIRCYVSFRK